MLHDTQKEVLMLTDWYYEENHSESEFAGDPHIAYLNFDFRSDALIPDCLAFDFLSVNT